jgi:hypothetical protein
MSHQESETVEEGLQYCTAAVVGTGSADIHPVAPVVRSQCSAAAALHMPAVGPNSVRFAGSAAEPLPQSPLASVVVVEADLVAVVADRRQASRHMYSGYILQRLAAGSAVVPIAPVVMPGSIAAVLVAVLAADCELAGPMPNSRMERRIGILAKLLQTSVAARRDWMDSGRIPPPYGGGGGAFCPAKLAVLAGLW